jgi:hypothetical protein
MKRLIFKPLLPKLLLLLLLLQTQYCLAQGPREAYIAQYKEVAVSEMLLYGIPASIKLAQGMLESGNGTSRLAQEGNNHFGIKCGSSWSGKTMTHHDDSRNECFRKYPHAEESFRDHSLFLLNGSRYKFLFELPHTDYQAWARGLQKAGYATNPKYADLLIKMIEENRLYEFDITDLVNDKYEPTAPTLIIMHHPNRIKYVLAYEGLTWDALSLQTEVPVRKLLQYNERRWDENPIADEPIFLQPKRKQGKSKIYIMATGDSMYSVAQKHGIRLESLYKRNKLKAGESLKAGNKVYLRGKRK